MGGQEGRAASEAAGLSGGRLTCLDGWRGFAILLVLLGHFSNSPGFDFGSLGVELFLVLSGRLIAHVLFVQDMPLGRFVLHRFARVYPALLAFLLVAGPLQALFGYPLPNIMVPLALAANYAYANGAPPPLLGHLWSLSLEEHSYIALTLVALLHRGGEDQRIQSPYRLGDPDLC